MRHHQFLTTGAIIAITAFGHAQTLVQSGFESPMALGPVSGQQGWLTDAVGTEFLVQSAIVQGGSQALRFDCGSSYGPNWAYRSVSYDGATANNKLVTVSAYVNLGTPTTAPSFVSSGGIELYGPSFAFRSALTIDSAGTLLLESDGGSQSASVAFALNGWNRIDLVLDYASNFATAQWNGSAVAIQVPLVGKTLTEFDIVARAGGYHPAYFDNVSMVAAPSLRTLNGTVNLNDFVATTAGRFVTVEFVQSGVLKGVTTTPLDANGNFTVTTFAAAGTYDIFVKGSHWLKKVQHNVVLNPIANGVVFDLVNGDVDGSNSVDLGDYLSLVAAFDTTFGNAGYVDSADLNGDLTVDLSDYLILTGSFDQTGDSF